MVDPGGIANWSVTHVDWSEGKWHPKAYRAKDVTYELLKNIAVCSTMIFTSFTQLLVCSFSLMFLLMRHSLQSIDVSVHVTSDAKVPCLSLKN